MVRPGHLVPCLDRLCELGVDLLLAQARQVDLHLVPVVCNQTSTKDDGDEGLSSMRRVLHSLSEAKAQLTILDEHERVGLGSRSQHEGETGVQRLHVRVRSSEPVPAGERQRRTEQAAQTRTRSADGLKTRELARGPRALRNDFLPGLPFVAAFTNAPHSRAGGGCRAGKHLDRLQVAGDETSPAHSECCCFPAEVF